MKHLLGIEQLSKEEITALIAHAAELKANRSREDTGVKETLKGETWAMIFTKSSTRTRVSFEVGLNELGATALLETSRRSMRSPTRSIPARSSPICSRFANCSADGTAGRSPFLVTVTATWAVPGRGRRSVSVSNSSSPRRRSFSPMRPSCRVLVMRR